MAVSKSKSWPEDATIFLPKLLACGFSALTISKLINRSQAEVLEKLFQTKVPRHLFSITSFEATFDGRDKATAEGPIFEALESGLSLGEVALRYSFEFKELVNFILDSNMLTRLSLNEVKKEHNFEEPLINPQIQEPETGTLKFGSEAALDHPELQKFSSGAARLHAMRAAWLKFRLEPGAEKVLQTWLKNREISEMFHFSPIDNLENILRQGLITIRELKLAKVTFRANDHDRFDNTGGICTSLGFPNYKLLYRAQEERNLNPVIIKISPLALSEIAWIAVPTNAAGNEMRSFLKANPEKLTGVAALSGLYEEIVRFSGSNKVTRAQLGLPISFPTDPQAEVIFLERIPAHYFLTLCVPDDFVLSLVQCVLDQSGFRVQIEIRPDLFTNRVDWKFWSGKRIRLENL
jgi:hypothetical protein